jgi:hypothetical protein
LENGQSESGSLSIQDPGANSPLNVSFESNAAKERRLDTPDQRAIRKYCSTATSQGCALYQLDVVACRGLSSTAYSILTQQRFWRSNGSSPEEAARLSLRGQQPSGRTLEVMVQHGMTLPSISDLQTIAQRAMTYPLAAPAQTFSENIFDDCVARK